MEEYYKSQIGDEPSLREKTDFTYNFLRGLNEKEKRKLKKKLKLPRRARVSKSRKKKGYCGVIFINENQTASAQKVKLDGGTYQTKDENYHVTNGSELIFWEGKFPILWQRYDKLNPTNLVAKEGEQNEIYGQDLVMLRMKRDAIKTKGKGGFSWVYMILILGGGYFLLKTFFPALFGG